MIRKIMGKKKKKKEAQGVKYYFENMRRFMTLS
jgi:guanylate kinase